MTSIRKTIVVKERDVELLFSATLGLIADRKGIRLVLDDADDKEASFRFFVSLIYLAALNAWEFMRLDDASLGDFPFASLDFAEWATLDADEFGATIAFAGQAMAGLSGGSAASDIKKK